MIIVLIFIGLLVLIFVCNILYKNTNYYRDVAERENRFLLRQDFNDVKIVNVGSAISRFAYDYSALGIKGANLATSPQTLEYDYKILKQFKSKLSEGTIVIINLPEFVFCAESYDKFDDKNYYIFDEYKNNKKLLTFLHCHFPVLFSGKNFLHIILDSKRKNYIDNMESEYDFEKSAKKAKEMYTGWTTQFNINPDTLEVPENIKSVEKNNVKILDEMISFCKGNKWIPLLMTSPISGTLNSLFPQKLTEEVLYDNINSLKNDIQYYDFREQLEFQQKYSYYIDGNSWLTKKGRLEFMKIVKNTVETIKGE